MRKKNLFMLFVLFAFSSVSAQISQPFVVDFQKYEDGLYTRQDAISDFPITYYYNYYDGFNEEMAYIVSEGDNKVLRVKYPEGCLGPNFPPEGCAVQIKWKLPDEEQSQTMWVSYKLKIEEGFDFRRGGKLPGLAGGKAYTGGNKPAATGDGWSARIMWRPGGVVKQYVYYVDQVSNYGDYWDWLDETNTECKLIPGQWHEVTTQVVLNTISEGQTVGNHDGAMRSWLDGKLVMEREGIRLVNRTDPEQKVDFFLFSTFHGGDDDSWSPLNDSYIRYDDIIISETCPIAMSTEKVWLGEGRGATVDGSANPALSEFDSKRWSLSDNWQKNTLPVSGDEVSMATGACDLYVDLPNVRIKQIKNLSNANLVILPEAKLTITDSPAITSINPESRVLIKADAVKASGSLVLPTGEKQDASVEFITKATIADGPTLTTNDMPWQFFGIPIKGAAVSTYFSDVWIRQFTATQVTTDEGIPYYRYWSWVNASDNLQPFTGYELCIPANEGKSLQITYHGELLTEDKSVEIVRRASDYFEGQWVMSNPYIYGVDISSGIDFGNELQKQVWLFHTGSSAQWEDPEIGNGGMQEGSIPGQYEVKTVGTGGVIPSMQGFVVRLKDGEDSGSVAMIYGDDNDGINSPMYVSGNMRAIPEDEKIYTTISLLGNNRLMDRMWIYTYDASTYGFDDGFDGHKMFAGNALPQLYSTHPDDRSQQYQIDVLPVIENTSLHIKATQNADEYVLRFNHSSGMEAVYESLYLEDLQTNKRVDVLSDDSEYAFIAKNTDDAEERFRLHGTIKSSTVLEEQAIDSSFEINQDFQNVIAYNNSDFAAKICIYEISGRLIYSNDIRENSSLTIPKKMFDSGIMILKIQSSNSVSKLIKKLVVYNK